MSETYTVVVNCHNCGFQFDVEVPQGKDLDDSWNPGARLRWYKTDPVITHRMTILKRHDIRCPHCGSDNCCKDRKDWPWREKSGEEKSGEEKEG